MLRAVLLSYCVNFKSLVQGSELWFCIIVLVEIIGTRLRAVVLHIVLVENHWDKVESCGSALLC